MVAVRTVMAVAKEVNERTRKQQQKRKPAETGNEMCLVLTEQVEGGYTNQKPDAQPSLPA